MIALVAHDAGGAEYISTHARRHKLDARYAVAGPARLVFERKLGAIPIVLPEDAIRECSELLCGTGWQTDMEFAAIKLARALGKRSVAVLDHWVNYRERFVRGGETCWPDEIWVTDEYALTEARRCFPGLGIRLQPNLYLEELVQEIEMRPVGDGILYVLEPVHAAWAVEREGEFQALDYFVANLGKLGITPDTPIRLRPHPSDATGKYAEWLAAQGGLNVALDHPGPLSEAISRAAWVVGCETHAMVVGLASGRKVVSTLPPWAHRCRLPHRDILMLRELP